MYETLFSLSTAPVQSYAHVPHTVFWVWIHLLQVMVSYQTLCPVKAAIKGRPWEPLSSGRIGFRDALLLRCLLIPLCLLLSAAYSMEVLYASVALVSLTILQNEMNICFHGIIKNIISACILSAFEIGGALVAGVSSLVTMCCASANTLRPRPYQT